MAGEIAQQQGRTTSTLFVEYCLESPGDRLVARVVQASHKNYETLFETRRVTFPQGFHDGAEALIRPDNSLQRQTYS